MTSFPPSYFSPGAFGDKLPVGSVNALWKILLNFAYAHSINPNVGRKRQTFTLYKRTSDTCLKILPVKYHLHSLDASDLRKKPNMDCVAHLIYDPVLRTENKEQDIPEPNKSWTRAYRPQTVSRSKWLALLFWFSAKYSFGDLYGQHARTTTILRLRCTNTWTSRTARG